MLTSENTTEINKALAIVQGQLKPAKKDAKNPYFDSMYADIASVMNECRELLSKNGIAVIQSGNGDGTGYVYVTTRLAHVSGQFYQDTLGMRPKDMSPQSVGSCITYGRRYLLAAMVGVVTDDDDGNEAQLQSKNKQKPDLKQDKQPIQKEKIVEKKEPIKFLSDEKITNLREIAGANGYTKQAATELLQARYGLTSSKELTKDQYDDLCKYMQAYPVTKQDNGESDNEPT